MVDVDDLVDILQSFDGAIGQRLCEGAVEMLAEDGVERFADERTLAASTHSRYANELAKRYLYVDILEVVAVCSSNRQRKSASFPVFGRRVNRQFVLQIFARKRVLLQHFLVGSLEDDFSASTASQRTDIDDIVGILHHFAVVLHNDYRVASVAKCF